MRARQCDIFGAVDRVTGAVGFDVHLVGTIALRPYLSAPAVACARLHWRSSVSDFTGAVGPRLASHLLTSRFMTYLKTTEQPASIPFGPSVPLQTSQRRKFRLTSLSTTLGMSAGSTITAPRSLRTAMASVIAFACSAFSPPRASCKPGGLMRS